MVKMRSQVLFALVTACGLGSGQASAPNFHGCVDPVARALPYCNTSLPLESRLDDLLSHMSLEEKVAQITPQQDLGDKCTTFTKGKKDIGLPEWVWLVETNTNIASACLREGSCATTFVGPMGMGASFNRTLWRLKGTVFGTEMRALSNIGGMRFNPGNKALIGLTAYGPNINIARDPRFGRASELPGEDPLLSGTYAYEMVTGMQERDSNGYPKTAAFLKHYTAYSTEANRGHDSYNISTFDFFDTYLPQYERAFRAQPAGVMCSYNAENGHPSCANDWLLNKVLRSWKPDAMVSTDCGAVNNLKGAPVNAPDDAHAAAFTLMNGTDLEMGDDLFKSLPAAITMGLATEERVDEAVRRTFRIHFQLGRFDDPAATAWERFRLEDVNSTHHQQIAYEAALQSLVLLKNENDALPLAKGKRIAVLGPQAIARQGLLSDYAADQICFSGDDHCIGTIAEAITAANIGGTTLVEQGVDMNSNRTGGMQQALAAAGSADVVVMALGNDKSIEHEGLDRADTALPGLQELFAEKVLALGKPTVLVLTNGGALAIDGIMHRGSKAPYAIVEAFNPAVVGGRAIAASIFGFENRWGKLPVTMYPHSFIHEKSMIDYDMTSSPGRTYRYYTGQPLFPFGHGLSLTTFSMSCQRDMSKSTSVAGVWDGSSLDLSCSVANTGSRAGDEVVQVYHRAVDIGSVSHPLPRRALIDFARISIQAAGSAEVKFRIERAGLELVNEHGVRKLYPGMHQLIFSRGHGEEITFDIQVPSTESLSQDPVQVYV
eukprot:CAMPEP_0115234328 /NCGR_PEP_ID=MMETSP0270-20121206/34737_1 /TAXON_ID=71861 /ORGANISM="Scrippsiella trochoidea, Strain CCMP3099" /LENGTH=774 /DNA_ID=CAMNT_0002649073 /DNA_START=30 /DNA_END=2354 /DNA_ORIENTATION=+